MADEEKDVEDAAPEPKKKSPIILIAVLVIVGLVLAAGISFFVTTKLMADTASEGGGNAKFHDPGVFIKLGDPKDGILVNVGGQKAGKFLKTSIILEMNPGKKDIILEGQILPVAETKIMDIVLQVLRSAKLDEFDAMKQDDLKKKIKEEINGVLGEGSVYDVYITSFLLQ